MLSELIRTDFAAFRDPAQMILVFFAYSHLGYLLECVVLTAEHRRIVINRGFVRHLPFCIIYGFGAMVGVPLLQAFEGNLLLLFVAGAIGASMLELLTARIQIHLFGDFWWDYTNKPFNFQGILCLESTIGWGLAAIIIVKFVNRAIVGIADMVPAIVAAPLAALLLTAYAVDFIISARASRREKIEAQQQQVREMELTENHP